MTQEQINATLDAMLENPKSKTFLNHLVRAYMPVTNVTKVIEKPKGDFKCVLTRESLQSVVEIQSAITDEKVQAFFVENLGKALASKTDSVSELEKLIGNKKLGFTGKETTTFMSYPAFQIFVDWVITKSLNGDKHINWLLGGIRRASFIERAETIQDGGVQKKVENFKKANKPKTATFALSDSSDVLSKLKAQLEAKGN
jgi:hypothetical protein